MRSFKNIRFNRRCPRCGFRMKLVSVWSDAWVRCMKAGCKYTREALWESEINESYDALSKTADNES